MGELGTRLLRAREARGLTLEDAERDTRISRRYLQALESEQFELIPAPVYARGFLRSYSQYLRLDPGEMLTLFPREDGGIPAPAAAPVRPQAREPISAVGAPRPTWKRPTAPGQGVQQPQVVKGGRIQPQPLPVEPYEPTIGVDIGVPVPARRLEADPSAQTRPLVVAGVAIAAIIVVVLLALMISRMGGGTGGTAPGFGASPAAQVGGGSAPVAVATPTVTGNGSQLAQPVQAGVVPDLFNLTAAQATQRVEAAGLKVDQKLQKSPNVPRGQVLDQSPAPGALLNPGQTVTIVVSDGP
jgi:cytoskeleton protein RodZ